MQALQSLALKAPRDKNLRAALYEVNIAQVRGGDVRVVPVAAVVAVVVAVAVGW